MSQYRMKVALQMLAVKEKSISQIQNPLAHCKWWAVSESPGESLARLTAHFILACVWFSNMQPYQESVWCYLM